MAPYGRTYHRRQYGACVLHAGYLRLQTHTQHTQYLFHFDDNSGYANARHYVYVNYFFFFFWWPRCEHVLHWCVIGSPVEIVSGQRTGGPGIDSRHGQEIFLLSKACISALGLKQHLYKDYH
jgi:hypothetical protein